MMEAAGLSHSIHGVCLGAEPLRLGPSLALRAFVAAIRPPDGSLGLAPDRASPQGRPGGPLRRGAAEARP